MRFEFPDVSVEVVKAHCRSPHPVGCALDGRGSSCPSKVKMSSGNRFKRRLARAELWFERTAAGRIVGGFMTALILLEIIFIFGIFQ